MEVWVNAVIAPTATGQKNEMPSAPSRSNRRSSGGVADDAEVADRDFSDGGAGRHLMTPMNAEHTLIARVVGIDVSCPCESRTIITTAEESAEISCQNRGLVSGFELDALDLVFRIIHTYSTAGFRSTPDPHSIGPQFKLLFGATVEKSQIPLPRAEDLDNDRF